MIDPIQPITIQQAYDGITHARRWASWNWWLRMVDDDDGDGFPSPKPRTDSRSALPRGFRAWRRLRIVKRDDFFPLIFLSPKLNIWRWSWSWRGNRSPRGGAPPALVARWWAPWPSSFAGIFLIFWKVAPWSFRSFWERLLLHINNTMVILLKTASVRVSFIQIMQVRVQNKGKSVWKSRYVGDVSTPPSLKLCLSSSYSVDKLKVIKKNFYKLFCSSCCKYVKPAFKFSAKIITNHIHNNT